jgi:hypothetical protein
MLWRGGWDFDCPHCDSGGEFHAGYNLDGGYTNCWRCGPLNLYETLTEITGSTWHELKILLAGLPNRNRKSEHEVSGRKLHYPTGIQDLLPCHRAYLKQRRFNPDSLVRLWQLRALGLSPRLPWRIFIPVLRSGKTVSWTTRSISDSHPRRYINADKKEEIISPKRLLFGEDFVRHSVIVCEGPFDVMRIGPGAVATMGLAYTRTQVSRIARFPIRVLCFDNEPDAQKRANKLCADLQVYPGKTSVVEIDAKDPGSASPREVRQLRKCFLD